MHLFPWLISIISSVFPKILKGDSKDVFEVAMPESISGSISVVSWSIVQEEDRNETSDLSASSTNESVLNCNNSKEDAGETAALLGM